MNVKSNVGYICDDQFVEKSDTFIPTKSRNKLVHELIKASNLLEKMTCIKPTPAKFQDMVLFHGTDYVNYLLNTFKGSCSPDDEDDSFGLGYDCPLVDGISEYCKMVAGGSLTAADVLCNKQCNIAIHWIGGWHHAKRNKASGYCYVNDCVLAILRLRQIYPKVLYIDFDLHHGDGVQDAFYATNKVFTYSVHKYESGFFPGTGDIKEVGFGKGRFHSVNVPLKDSICDTSFVSLNQNLLDHVRKVFWPDAIVCQVGADGLNQDPMGSFNLTTDGLVKCVKHVIEWNLPTLLLGGGGYNDANVARCWCTITADVLNVELPSEIPEHEQFPLYGPDFDFQISKGLRKDCNSLSYLDSISNTILNNLNCIG